MFARTVKTDFLCLAHSADCTLRMSGPQTLAFTRQKSRGTNRECARIITLYVQCVTFILTVILNIVVWSFSSAVLWKLGLFEPSGLMLSRAC